MPERILVTGATGYVGGRLVPRLLAAGHTVRILVRDERRAAALPWSDQVEIAVGDVTDREAMSQALRNVDVLYYFVHSMNAARDFEATDALAARTTAAEAFAAGVRRIIYLGGLHPTGVPLSKHLRSRQEVGEILARSGVPTISFQAGVVIGSGSASFEMIRHLTEVLPVMPAPKWVLNRIQPIAIRDVLHYLLGALTVRNQDNHVFDIGGPSVLKYSEMMNGYAEVAGLPRRRIWALPVLTPGLASHWVNLVTPIPRAIARPLVDSLQHECVVKDGSVHSFIDPPAEGLIPYETAVALALAKLRDGEVETSWQDSTVSAAANPLPSDPSWSGYKVYTDTRKRILRSSPERVWRVVESIGGENGWYSWPIAWAIRGWIDKLVGGVGLRRGRRDPLHLKVGDALDWWRVEALEPGKLLRLRAEMRVPGDAWLEMEVLTEANDTVYRQRAIFFPRGLSGRLYWWAVTPFHGIVFNGMANRIAAAGEDSRQA